MNNKINTEKLLFGMKALYNKSKSTESANTQSDVAPSIPSYYTSNDEREEKEIYVPNSQERFEAEKLLNKYSLETMAVQYKPYLDYAKKYRLVKIDSNGKRVYPTEITMVFTSEKITKKNWVTFYAILCHPKNIHLFMSEFSAKEATLMQKVIANHYVSLHDAELLLGEKMTEKRYLSHSWSDRKVLKAKYAMFYQMVSAIGPQTVLTYYGQEYLVLRKNIQHILIDMVFGKYLQMSTLDSLPEEDDLKVYNTEEDIFVNYPILVVLFESKQIMMGKSKVPATAVKKVQNMCNLQEFFPEGEKDANSLCAYIVANVFTLYAAAKGTNKAKKTETNIKAIITDMFEYMHYLIPIILSHVKGFRRTQLYNSYCNELCHIIQDVVSDYAQDGWLNIKSLCAKVRTYNAQAEYFWLLLSKQDFEQLKLQNSYNEHQIWLDNFIMEITRPFVKAYLFMMAAFGVVELAYHEKPDENDTCYYDTLQYVRLTDLGKYVFGITKKYEHKSAKMKNYFELDDNNLIIRSLDSNNPYKSVASAMAQPISKNMYKMSYESFLDSCQCLSDISNKIDMFRDNICQKPPVIWEQFFRDIQNRCQPLTSPQKKYQLVQIPADNKDLQRIILTDPTIRKYTLKVENFMILIESNNYKKVCDTLKKYGYLV